MNKKAQFFIITALIIATITISFGTVYNQAKVQEKEDVKTYEITEELHSEIQQAYDNGVLTKLPPDKIQQNIQKLAKYYASQNPDSNFVIFFGNQTNLKAIYTNQGKITEPKEVFTTTLNPSQDKFKACINFKDKETQTFIGKNCDIEREFTLKKEQSVYIVVRKKVKNEEVVIER